MMGKILAQHYQEQGGGGGVGGGDEKGRSDHFVPKLKVRVSSFCLIAWNHYWTKQKKNSVCICVYFPIHWCVVCKGQSTWHALFAMNERRIAVCAAETLLLYVNMSRRCQYILARAQRRLTPRYTKTWVMRAERRRVGPPRKSDGGEIADKFCY